MKKSITLAALACCIAIAGLIVSKLTFADAKSGYNPTDAALSYISKLKVGKGDWPQWSGWNGRNNTPRGVGIATDWDVNSGKNIKWRMPLGSQTYGNVVVANGHAYVGTNNGNGYIKRFPPTVDLGCLICFDEKTGKFLWQHSSTKLPAGRVVDWPLQGICCAPFVDGERLWYVTSRGTVCCLDTEGFHDGENDGPYKAEANENKDEGDMVWEFDMMGKLGTFQHNMCACSVTCSGDILLVNTSNGVDNGHINLPSPNAPSFFALDRNNGKVLWTDKSPGTNVLHGQWSSPTVGEFGGKTQAIFAGGDGWVYSFDPQGDGKGNSKLYWKFDCNPKRSVWVISGRGTRNNIIATPVIYDGMVYVAVGQDPEHSEGMGHLWCIDPTLSGDTSPTLMFSRSTDKPIPHRRLLAYQKWQPWFDKEIKDFKKADYEAFVEELKSGKVPKAMSAALETQKVILPEKLAVAFGDDGHTRGAWTVTYKKGDELSEYMVVPKHEILRNGDSTKEILSLRFRKRTDEVEQDNPNSAVVWHYGADSIAEYRAQDFEEAMHRSCGTSAIKNDLLYIADFSGLFHCVDAKTGKPHWTYDMFAQAWGSPCIVEGKVYIGDDDGDVTIFELSSKMKIIKEINMDNAVYSTPVVANDILFISNKSNLFAISAK